MKKYTPVMFAIILGMTTMFVGHKVSALSCVAATLQQQIDSATVIFAGKVTAVQTATSDKAAYASFDVTEYWKGQIGKKISVGGIYAWTGYANPPSYFIVGNTYLVFANSVPASSEAKNIPDNLIASINCGKTTLLESATETKIALGQGKIPTGQSSFTYARNLTVGFSGEDVVGLQTLLEQKGFLVIPSGITKGYFGSLTKNAVAKYQSSKGIIPAIGYFGPITRKSVNDESLIDTKPSITVLYPNGGETWKIGSQQTIGWNLQGNIPAGYRLGIFLSDGGFIAQLNTGSSNTYTFTVPESIFHGDVGSSLTPGKYKVNVILYDGDIGLGNFNPNYQWGKAVAQDSSDADINITD